MKKEIKAIIKKAESLGWNIDISDNEITFNQYSPEGQDFSFSIDKTDDIEELVNSIYERYDNYDVSSEAYLWLDSDGHGMNGAPYDMKDLYEDMEACKDMINDLYNGLKLE